MDALALFCNLHGNGPETLAALRDAGCERLGQVADMEAERLEALLGRDASGVARFQREAAVLARRVDGELEADPGPKPQPVVEPEPTTSVLQPAAREVRPNDLDRERALLESLQSKSEDDPAPPKPIHGHNEPQAPQAECVAEPANKAYGKPAEGEAAPKVDRLAQLASPKEPSMGPVATAVIDLWRSLDQPALSGVQPKDTAAANVDQPLSELAGLSAAVVDALARIGIESVAALAAAEPLELARRTTLPYTHLAHMTFLARRTLESSPSPASEPAAARGNSEAGPYPAREEADPADTAGPSEERDTPPDAGGPFA